MSKPVSGPAPTMSRRTGALIMRSISLFLAGGRVANKSAASNVNAKQCKGKSRMVDRDNKNKCSAKIIEAAKRETHFNRYVSLFKI